MSRQDIIQKYNQTYTLLKECNEELRSHFYPLLDKACQSGNKAAFNDLCSQIPEGSFYLSVLRMGELYFPSTTTSLPQERTSLVKGMSVKQYDIAHEGEYVFWEAIKNRLHIESTYEVDGYSTGNFYPLVIEGEDVHGICVEDHEDTLYLTTESFSNLEEHIQKAIYKALSA